MLLSKYRFQQEQRMSSTMVETPTRGRRKTLNADVSIVSDFL